MENYMNTMLGSRSIKFIVKFTNIRKILGPSIDKWVIAIDKVERGVESNVC